MCDIVKRSRDTKKNPFQVPTITLADEAEEEEEEAQELDEEDVGAGDEDVDSSSED